MANAFFLTGAQAPLFTLYWPGASDRAPVLLLPPLLEEMNRSRRQLHDLAEALAARGLPVLLPDLTGTGDSGGELATLDWSIWQADIRCMRDWLAAHHSPPPLLCAMRAGALLMAEHSDCPQLAIAPIFSGSQQLQQWLRLKKMAARMAGETLTDAGLQAELATSGVEVAGYWLSAAFAASLAAVNVPLPVLPHAPRGLLELISAAEPSPALQDAVRLGWQWRAVAGERCWESAETTCNAALTAAAVETLIGWAAGHEVQP